MTEKIKKVNKPILIQCYLIIIGVLALSFLRPLLFVFLPFFVFGFILLFKARYSKNIFILGISIIIVTVISSIYIGEFNLSNNILSFYFIFPILLIFFSRIKIEDKAYCTYFEFFIDLLTIILIINNCLGFIQFILAPESDDSFIGFYGMHGLGLHTLSLINFMLGAYYFFLFQEYKTKKNIGLFVFFLLSAVFCFYGLGLAVFILSVFVYRFSVKTFLKSILLFVLVISVLGTFLYLFRYKTFQYNYENIKKAELFFDNKNDPQLEFQIPRKLILHKNYIQVYSKDIGLFLLGSGPGTFNSRTSFLLNGDYSRSGFFEKVFGIHNPAYAVRYVYPLWNSKIVSFKLFTDGTRNEPFSSIVSMLAEYGFLISILIFILVFHKYKVLIRKINYADTSKHIRPKSYIYSNYIKFISIFIFLNLFSDNFFEYPEIMLLYVIIFKLVDMAVTKSINDNLKNNIELTNS